MDKAIKRRVLFTLFDQRDAIGYARQLVSLGWEIIATKETFNLFKVNKIAATDFSTFFGIKDKYPFPPTLHPSLELALTTDNGRCIDLVYVITYPLSKGNDVGGHTILQLAAKGKKIAVSNKKDMQRVIRELRRNNNEILPILRQELIDKVNAKVAKHYMSLVKCSQDSKITGLIIAKKTMSLLEGENPYQLPADLFGDDDNPDPLVLSKFKQISGIVPCYTNMADFDCILHTLCLLSESFIKQYKKIPYIVIAAKHGSPCGLAVDWNSPKITVEKALFGNPLAIFGGEVITNFTINQKLAQMLSFNNRRERLLGNSKWSLDLIAAPSFHLQAIYVLGERKRLKLFTNKKLAMPQLSKADWSYRMVRGGFLRQPPNNYVLDISQSKHDFSLPNSNLLDSLIVAWAVAWSSSHGGNEVALVKDRMLLGVGGGPSTIDACRTAIDRARTNSHNLQGSVFAADAFFPFIDGPAQLVKTGCVYGIVPAGGVGYGAVKDYFRQRKVNVFYLPEQFRGFCRH